MGKQARRLLEAAMARAGMDGKDCAKAMNLSLAAFYRKMNGHVGWTTWQARLLDRKSVV